MMEEQEFAISSNSFSTWKNIFYYVFVKNLAGKIKLAYYKRKFVLSVIVMFKFEVNWDKMADQTRKKLIYSNVTPFIVAGDIFQYQVFE